MGEEVPLTICLTAGSIRRIDVVTDDVAVVTLHGDLGWIAVFEWVRVVRVVRSGLSTHSTCSNDNNQDNKYI